MENVGESSCRSEQQDTWLIKESTRSSVRLPRQTVHRLYSRGIEHQVGPTSHSVKCALTIRELANKAFREGILENEVLFSKTRDDVLAWAAAERSASQ